MKRFEITIEFVELNEDSFTDSKNTLDSIIEKIEQLSEILDCTFEEAEQVYFNYTN